MQTEIRPNIAAAVLETSWFPAGQGPLRDQWGESQRQHRRNHHHESRRTGAQAGGYRMRILTKCTIVLRGGRTVPPNHVVTLPDEHARRLIKNGSAEPGPENICRSPGWHQTSARRDGANQCLT